jgi:hypothetical protein
MIGEETESMSLLPEYNLPENVARLVKFCEKVCDHGCCGIDAFDFSPLHVASYISAITGGVRDCDIAEWDERLAEVERATRILEPNDDGFVCYIPNINHAFSRSHIEALIAEIRHSIRAAPEVAALSNQLASVTPPRKHIEGAWLPSLTYTYAYGQETESMSQLPEYKLPYDIAGLVDACRKSCVSDCSGVDAFDFSPLHVASFILGDRGICTRDMYYRDIAEWVERLAEVERAIRILEPNEDGFVCYIANLNQYISRSRIEALIAEIRHSIRSAPVVVALSNHLASDTPVCKLIEDDWQRSQRKIQHDILPAAFVKFNWIGFIVKILAAATICSLIKMLI